MQASQAEIIPTDGLYSKNFMDHSIFNLCGMQGKKESKEYKHTEGTYQDRKGQWEKSTFKKEIIQAKTIKL